jgi:hypothetical protein
MKIRNGFKPTKYRQENIQLKFKPYGSYRYVTLEGQKPYTLIVDMPTKTFTLVDEWKGVGLFAPLPKDSIVSGLIIDGKPVPFVGGFILPKRTPLKLSLGKVLTKGGE